MTFSKTMKERNEVCFACDGKCLLPMVEDGVVSHTSLYSEQSSYIIWYIRHTYMYIDIMSFHIPASLNFYHMLLR
jgi:hypothetical protein